MKIVFTIAGFFALLTVKAQTIALDKLAPQRPFIEVTGTAMKNVAPDKIFISITLSERNSDVQAQEVSLKKVLTEMNVSQSQLSLSDATSEIIKDKKRDVGVKQSQEYTLELKSADQVITLFKKLSEVNIKEASF
ncbi:MAG: hypothetical protein JST68_21870 [Bacteroidetes bacterium]|nr:hypothetical protein [Bacteroidota bacterium]